MAKMDPNRSAKEWADRLAASGQKIATGVQAVTVAPTELAAKKKDKYIQGVQDAVASGKWERGLRSVSLSDWQQAMTTKGISRIPEGARSAQGKMERFMAAFFPVLERNLQQVKSMPDATFEDRMNRMVAMARLNHEFKMPS